METATTTPGHLLHNIHITDLFDLFWLCHVASSRTIGDVEGVITSRVARVVTRFRDKGVCEATVEGGPWDEGTIEVHGDAPTNNPCDELRRL